ncbi:MAG: hypothetical protein Sv326_1333 (plasmid) [Candidatus Fermentimicrarchaeum limneticum]|uniref:Uncharacterized protein n=1 Tax=Fermentimicrarchaeum limneticum TaxID=2795018 RepID=A0A7D5XML4_FERL1|nr:MAG: hypothetical protein Sv326_1333 [Candidatus Fermentimicrarchaeum limneticum]
MRIDISEKKGMEEIEKLAEKYPHFFAGTVIERVGSHVWVMK